MGLFSFISDAGQKLFGGSQIDENAVRDHILGLGLKLSALSVIAFQDEKKVAVIGRAQSLEDKEKAILAAGNVKGVELVEDRLRVVADEAPASTTPAATPTASTEDEQAELSASEQPSARFYTVVAGDTLSAIAKREYGSANAYPRIFEANRPMLSHPDKIYPGQVLRIPPEA
jgi:nucleoid-associated protein YgaU